MSFLGIGASGPNFGPAQATQGVNTNIAGTLAAAGSSGLAALPGQQQQQNTAANTAVNYLEQNPYTSAVNSSLLNSATAGDAANAERAQSNANLGLAASGLTDSSIAAGADAGIQQQELGELNSNQNAIANNEVAGTGQRLAEAAGIASQNAQQNLQEGLAPTAEGASILGGVTQDQINEANATYQAQQQGDNVLGGVLGPLAGAAANYLAPGSGALIGAAAGAGQPPYNPNVNIPGTVPGYTTDYSQSGYLNG